MHFRRDSIRPNGTIKKAVETRPRFEELQSLEKERREILHRAELPFWRIICFWSGTCLKSISTSFLVWFALAIYVGIRIYANSVDYVPESVPLLEDSNIDVLGGFLSFFLVLFVNQTQSRFLAMHGLTKACSGKIQDLAGLARAQLPSEMGRKLIGHLNAAHIAGYVGLNGIGQSSPYSKAFFFDVYNEEHNLLTTKELRRIELNDMDQSGLCYKELCTWCQIEVADARRTGHLDAHEAEAMQHRILAFRAAIDGIYDYSEQPPHFFYIHFLDLLAALYLPLFSTTTAVTSGWGSECFLGLDVLNGLIVLLQCIFVVGLRALGTNMIDPFGDDAEDLSVILYVEGTLEATDAILDTQLDSAKTQLPSVNESASGQEVHRSSNDARNCTTAIEGSSGDDVDRDEQKVHDGYVRQLA